MISCKGKQFKAPQTQELSEQRTLPWQPGSLRMAGISITILTCFWAPTPKDRV